MSMATRRRSLLDLWRSIEQAGGIQSYVDTQLRERGFLVSRRDTDEMSKAELGRYKKQLKEEAAERRRLKAESWSAYKEAHILHLGEGVFWNEQSDLDKYDLPEPEARANENELPQLDNPKALAEALGISIAELRWMSFHRDAAKVLHYQRFTIPKSGGGEREIWAPRPKLKAAQRWILRKILEHLPVHGRAHGFLPGRSILSNAQEHRDSEMILNMDLKEFFPTITWRRVKGVFRKAGYREQVATLLALLCTEAPREVVEHQGERYFISLGPRALPQGAPSSPALSNTLCLRLDRRLSGLARKLGWRYSRYADDLSFSLPHKKRKRRGGPKLSTLMGGARAIVEDEGFQLNPKKTRLRRTGARQEITGLVVNGAAGPRVPRQLKRQLRAAIHNLERGQKLPEGESIARLSGYAAFVYMAEPELGRSLLERLKQIQRPPHPAGVLQKSRSV